MKSSGGMPNRSRKYLKEIVINHLFFQSHILLMKLYKEKVQLNLFLFPGDGLPESHRSIGSEGEVRIGVSRGLGRNTPF